MPALEALRKRRLLRRSKSAWLTMRAVVWLRSRCYTAIKSKRNQGDEGQHASATTGETQAREAHRGQTAKLKEQKCETLTSSAGSSWSTDGSPFSGLPFSENFFSSCNGNAAETRKKQGEQPPERWQTDGTNADRQGVDMAHLERGGEDGRHLQRREVLVAPVELFGNAVARDDEERQPAAEGLCVQRKRTKYSVTVSHTSQRGEWGAE